MAHDDVTLIRHMIDAAQAAIQFVEGHERKDLDTDLELVFALVRALEIVGEAAGRVSEVSRLELRDVPWGSIVGMRNRLIHAYFDVELDIVWDTVVLNLPPLARTLSDHLESSNQE